MKAVDQLLSKNLWCWTWPGLSLYLIALSWYGPSQSSFLAMPISGCCQLDSRSKPPTPTTAFTTMHVAYISLFDGSLLSGSLPLSSTKARPVSSSYTSVHQGLLVFHWEWNRQKCLGRERVRDAGWSGFISEQWLFVLILFPPQSPSCPLCAFPLLVAPSLLSRHMFALAPRTAPPNPSFTILKLFLCVLYSILPILHHIYMWTFKARISM